MAPRGRKTKTGSRRIDAAYDALVPLGFARDEIRETIESLLTVYGGCKGGPEGWVFIEEGCYKLVIDTILEKQEQLKNEGGSATSGALEISEPIVDAGDTSLHPEVIENGLNPGPGEFAMTSGAANELPAMAVDASLSALVVVKVEDESPSVLPAANAGDPAPSLHRFTAGDTIQSRLPQASPSVMTGNAGPSSSQQPNEVARRRRPPCYGWISETESEE